MQLVVEEGWEKSSRVLICLSWYKNNYFCDIRYCYQHLSCWRVHCWTFLRPDADTDVCISEVPLTFKFLWKGFIFVETIRHCAADRKAHIQGPLLHSRAFLNALSCLPFSVLPSPFPSLLCSALSYILGPFWMPSPAFLALPSNNFWLNSW